MKAGTRDVLFRAARLLPLAFVLSLSTPVLAQDIVTAEALFSSGLADMEAGHYDKGCKALAESQRLDPRMGTLFTLATCEERWGHVATAVIRFEDFILLYERLREDRRATHAARYKVAVETRDRLKPDVPRWTLSLPPGAPAGTVVKRDGEVIPEPALGIAVQVDPGEHVVSTQAPGGPLLEKKVTVAKGQTLTLTLEIAPPGTATAPSATLAPQSSAAPKPSEGDKAPSGHRAEPETGPGVRERRSRDRGHRRGGRARRPRARKEGHRRRTLRTGDRAERPHGVRSRPGRRRARTRRGSAWAAPWGSLWAGRRSRRRSCSSSRSRKPVQRLHR